MKSEAPLLRHLRLRFGVDAIRTGVDSMLFVTAPRPIRLKGPHIADVTAPLIAALDGRSSPGELAQRLPDIEPDAIHAALEELTRIGMLREGTPALSGALLDAWHFAERFAAVADERSRAPRSMSDGAFYRADIRINSLAPWAELLRQHLAALGATTALSTESATHADFYSFASVAVEALSLRIELHASVRDRNRIHVLTTPLPQATMEAVTLPGSAMSEASTTAIIAHWIFAACLGMPVTPVLAAGDGARHRGVPAVPVIAPNAAPAPRHADEYPQDLTGKLNLICAMATGWLAVDGVARHIAPTSGDRASVHAVCFAARDGRRGADALYFNALSGSLSACAHIPSSAAQDLSDSVACGAVLLIMASTGPLLELYGNEARRLACHDAGFALDHAERAARGLGMTTTCLEQTSASELLRRIGVQAAGEWEVPCAPLAIRPIGNADDRLGVDSAAHLAHPLRPILERRSIRQFSSSPIAMDLVFRLEHALEQTALRSSWWCNEEQRVMLIRIVARDNDTIEVSRVRPGAHTGTAEHMTLPRHLVHRVIGQSDLAVAPLIYLVVSGVNQPGAGDATNSERAWGMEGALCSALWREALSLGLAGAPYGSADAAPLSMAEGTIGKLALCLGKR